MTTPADLPTRRLGRGGPLVSAIGLGGVPLSCPASRPTQEDAIELLRHAVLSGITFVDTADSYCRSSEEYGHNERLVAAALAGLPKDVREGVVVATKAGWSRPGGRWIAKGDPRWLRERCEASLVNLRTDRIDLFHHHVLDPDVPAEDSLGALVRLQEEGKIRHLGLSNYPVEETLRCLPLAAPICLQVQISPWNPKALHDGTLDLARDHQITVIAWGPFGGVKKASGLGNLAPRAEAIAQRLGISLHRLTLAWLLSKGPALIPIPGFSQRHHVDDAIRAAEVVLDDEILRQLDRVWLKP